MLRNLDADFVRISKLLYSKNFLMLTLNKPRYLHYPPFHRKFSSKRFQTYKNAKILYILQYLNQTVEYFLYYIQQNIFYNLSNQRVPMQTLRNMLMHYIVKLLLPESPAYGNTTTFIKQESLEEVSSGLEIGDIIFTKTNNSWYQLSRKFLKIQYDHVSIVITKNQVLHISPPIISKLDLNHIMQKSRQPLIIRMNHDKENKEAFISILISFLGEKYNESAIPIIFKNELSSRIFKPQQQHTFTFQNLKYSKICTEAILYALCKPVQKMHESIETFMKEKSRYKELGFILPDQMLSFLEEEGGKIVYKAPKSSDKTMVDKVEENLALVSEKLSTLLDFGTFDLVNKDQVVNVAKKLWKASILIKKKHPWYSTISLILIVYQLLSGSKINKTLLVYSVIATIMLARLMPQQIQIKNPLYSKL